MSNALGSLSIDGNKITLKRAGQSELIQANILGIEMKDNKRIIYVDRLIHERSDTSFLNFKVHGAISSILTEV